MAINFSPEIMQFLPIYLGISVQEFVKVTQFKYTKMYYYNTVKGESVLNYQINQELNIVWDKLGLNYGDLDNIYQLSKLVNEGSNKLEEYRGGYERG